MSSEVSTAGGFDEMIEKFNSLGFSTEVTEVTKWDELQLQFRKCLLHLETQRR